MFKISIVTVCFNSAKTIQKCISSVKKQKDVNVEYIFIDGGSSDLTVEIIKSNDCAAKIVSEQDDGIYHAMNKGLNLATGDFVVFLNSDDYFASEDVLSKIISEIDVARGIDAIFADIEILSVQGDGLKRRYYSSQWFKPWMLRFGIAPPHPGAIFKRIVLKDLGGFNPEYKIAGDYDLISRAFQKNINYQLSSVVLTYMKSGGISSLGFRSYVKSTKELMLSCGAQGFALPWLVFFRLPFKYFIR